MSTTIVNGPSGINSSDLSWIRVFFSYPALLPSLHLRPFFVKLMYAEESFRPVGVIQVDAREFSFT